MAFSRLARIALPALLALGSVSCSWPAEAIEDRDVVLLTLVREVLNDQHYAPPSIDDAFSAAAYESLLRRMDPSKQFFTGADLDVLSRYKTRIDDEVLNGEPALVDQLVPLYLKRIANAGSHIDSVLAKPFDFELDETIERDTDKIDAPRNSTAMRERWRKILKHEAMREVEYALLLQTNPPEPIEGDPPKEPDTRDFAQIEIDVRDGMRRDYKGIITRLSKTQRDDVLGFYINAVTSVYDPHTNYFAPIDRENFDIGMTGELEGIGASLKERHGYVQVWSIVPGSASAKQGQLEAKDIILKVGQGSDDPVDLGGMRLDDAVQLIRGKKGTEVRLTVRKPDQSVVLIPIIRDRVVIEATYASSAMLEGDVGYIDLPSFYADLRNPNGRHCYNDVAKELERLKGQGMKQLVFDLRGNGGGSLGDAIEIAGLFIDKGPVVQVRSKGEAPTVLADESKGAAWEGPLVVLVDVNSASASEILAAAMQDYGRGVIVGTSATFGKGTVQQFMPLDRIAPSALTGLGPLGDVKLTVQKFYRIDGGATQLKGVTPDVMLPGPRSYVEWGEKEQPNVMPWDEVPQAKYRPTRDVNPSKLESKSAARVKADAVFAFIDTQARTYSERTKKTEQSLNMAVFQAEMAANKARAEEAEALFDKVEPMLVSALPGDLERLEGTVLKSFNEKLKGLSKDTVLQEAVKIARDIK